MKIALITDTHFGARSDSVPFDMFFEKFYKETFFPYLDEHGIKTVFHLGDVFDRRKYVNFSTLKSCRRYFFDKLEERGITTHIIAGNHDTFFKNTNDINSPDLLLNSYKHIKTYSEATELDFEGTKILAMPWICSGNYEQSLNAMKDTTADICFGHFEIAGFEMHKGQVNDHGMDRALFKKFDIVYSGHFHHKSESNNITYLGNPYEMTWVDFEDPRGFHIFDTETRELTFVKNPFTIFHKLYYDDKDKDIFWFDGIDVGAFNNAHVKLVVINKTNFHQFDRLVDRIYKANPLELKIIEDFSEFESEVLDDESIDLEDTMTLLSNYVDSVETEHSKDRIKSMLKTLYLEAQSGQND